jgi:hypothetical protein
MLVKKASFFHSAAADIAQSPLIIEKSQQMAAKYWSYQQNGTFSRAQSRDFGASAKKNARH